LGDAYVNFIYSLALSKRLGEPLGKKVSSDVLAKSLKKANLRDLLPSRIDRHKQADAAEALILYVWARKIISLDEAVRILESEEMPEEGFSLLLKKIWEKVKSKSII